MLLHRAGRVGYIGGANCCVLKLFQLPPPSLEIELVAIQLSWVKGILQSFDIKFANIERFGAHSNQALRGLFQMIVILMLFETLHLNVNKRQSRKHTAFQCLAVCTMQEPALINNRKQRCHSWASRTNENE